MTDDEEPLLAEARKLLEALGDAAAAEATLEGALETAASSRDATELAEVLKDERVKRFLQDTEVYEHAVKVVASIDAERRCLEVLREAIRAGDRGGLEQVLATHGPTLRAAAPTSSDLGRDAAATLADADDVLARFSREDAAADALRAETAALAAFLERDIRGGDAYDADLEALAAAVRARAARGCFERTSTLESFEPDHMSVSRETRIHSLQERP